MEFFDAYTINHFFPIIIALLLGMLIGSERTLAHKTAGLRTYGLVAMGAALFIVIAKAVSLTTALDGDAMMRVVAGIITGLGFLCAGVIIFRDTTVTGLTTAAGLWLAAGIGIACGFGLYGLAVLTTALTLVTFTIFWFVEREVREIGGDKV